MNIGCGGLHPAYTDIKYPQSTARSRGRRELLHMRHFHGTVALTALLLLGACLNPVPDTESMLAAAGFSMEPANTPELTAQLQALPPHRLLVQPPHAKGEPPIFVYGDPDQCHCLFVGGPANYQSFQQLVVQRRIADEQMNAAMMNENAGLDWGMWTPPIVVVEPGRR